MHSKTRAVISTTYIQWKVPMGTQSCCIGMQERTQTCRQCARMTTTMLVRSKFMQVVLRGNTGTLLQTGRVDCTRYSLVHLRPENSVPLRTRRSPLVGIQLASS